MLVLVHVRLSVIVYVRCVAVLLNVLVLVIDLHVRQLRLLHANVLFHVSVFGGGMCVCCSGAVYVSFRSRDRTS